jgi:DNA-binding CsgD family transcriptional regulator
MLFCSPWTRAEPLVLELVTAEARDSGSAAISVIPLDASALSALIEARIDALCERARITPRERAVLDRTLLGCSQKDIAAALAITIRTVKYHHANLNAKLGADSRADLMRLFL